MKRTDCIEMVKAPNGTFNRAVEDLIKCGYIVEFQREYEKGNPLYLQLIDPFILFHYHFINKKGITSYDKFTSDTGAYHNWRGQERQLLSFSLF